MMAKQRKTIGSGITAREVTVCDGEDGKAALIKHVKRWAAEREKAGGAFGAACLHMIKQCHEVIANAGDKPYDADSDADFARRIIDSYNIAQDLIRHGDADGAARFALDVGVLATQAKMKQDWERHALRGKKNFLTLREAARAGNEGRAFNAKHHHEGWQAWADEIWSRDPQLNNLK
jgi:hypothetical protein